MSALGVSSMVSDVASQSNNGTDEGLIYVMGN